jgi:zinc transport system permease protein
VTFFELFALPPLLKGFLALLAAGAAFPLIGVFILRLHLIALKFTLMHGAFLGGALALALGVDPLLTGGVLTFIIVLTLSPLARTAGINEGYVAGVFMTIASAAAFIVIYKLALPAKDVFSLLWGNVFALGWLDVGVTALWALLAAGFVLLFFRPITAVLFDKDIAFSAGVNEKLISNLISVAAGFTVTLCLKLLGALLLDAVLILPAVAALLVARSARSLFLLAAVFGLAFAASGFAAAAAFDLPASAGVTAAGAVGFAICFVYSRVRRRSGKAALTTDGHE